MHPERYASSNPLIPLVIAGALLFSMLSQVSGYSGRIPPDAGERISVSHIYILIYFYIFIYMLCSYYDQIIPGSACTAVTSWNWVSTMASLPASD